MKFKTKMELVAAQKPILFQRFCLKNALTRAKKHVKMAKNSVCDAKSPKVINAILLKFETKVEPIAVKKPILLWHFCLENVRASSKKL